ncbi:unnamed protein product [Prunus armeniaca]|uniref:Uncharacterized protein n=1 Tax=Prunus armeniaca TaxID=36596 RepID=A0A6J5Y1H7_PRUAR|nr:hypothetical protein GBA52_028954 [Prunus armeniaca]CAB4287895.1 unnamed protein product [Prunus armeniaca]CAB4318267.1 unnamed protein product [Prunus armeniaca]
MGKTLHLSISDKDLSAATADVRHDHLQSQLDGVVDSISSLEAHQTDIQTSPLPTSVSPALNPFVGQPPLTSVPLLISPNTHRFSIPPLLLLPFPTYLLLRTIPTFHLRTQNQSSFQLT